MKAFLKEKIKDKKVLILGFGKEGSATLSLLQSVGGYDSLHVADKNSVDIPGIPCICGDSYMDALEDYDLIFKSPGIAILDPNPNLLAKLTSQTACFLERYRDQIIGVTGTKGKSTTSSLIYHALKSAGKPAYLMGNIGLPAFEQAESIEDDAVIVYEMSAHQLQYVSASPKTAVFLNLFPEHLDYYKTVERYQAAKENIYRFQKPGDLLIINEALLPAETPAETIITGDSEKCDIHYTEKGVSVCGTELTPENVTTHLLGKHNLYNIGVAYAAVRKFGISLDTFLSCLQDFDPLPHRLRDVGVFGGVRYVDDSISTVPQTTIGALSALSDVDTLILGGMDRGVDLSPLLDYLAEHPIPHILVAYDTGVRLMKESEAYPALLGKLTLVADLEDAVKLASKITTKGKTCLLSPAAASYGYFKNFEDRGDRFLDWVKKYNA